MKSIRKISLLFVVGVISISTYCQNINLEPLKKENAKLKKELTISKIEKDSFQLVITKLIQDTTFLRSELALCTLYNNGLKTENVNSNSNFKTTFISCKGNRSTQSVEFIFIIQHNIPNQNYIYQSGKAFDSQGQTYAVSECKIGGEIANNRILIPTNTPTKIMFTFNNILPGNDFFNVIAFNYNYMNTDLTNLLSGSGEFRNIKIKWD